MYWITTNSSADVDACKLQVNASIPYSALHAETVDNRLLSLSIKTSVELQIEMRPDKQHKAQIGSDSIT